VPAGGPDDQLFSARQALLYFLFLEEAFVGRPGKIEETPRIGTCALLRKRPARFVWRGITAAAFREWSS
jgi:hypothetical protein